MNKPFHQAPYVERYLKMGDEAETAFEERNDSWVRYGLNRPPFHIHKMPLGVRYTPDYLQGNPQRLVEVMGMGKTPLKLKLEKISALSWWDHSGMDLYFWIWSSTRQNFAALTYSEMVNIINKEDVPLGKFPEGKAYFSISSKLLPWDDG